MAAPRFIADLPVPLPGAVVRRAYPAIRGATALGRAASCMDYCFGDLICVEKCTCKANTLACYDYYAGVAMVCSAACLDEDDDEGADDNEGAEGDHTVECLRACTLSQNFGNFLCQGYQHGCNASAEATGGEPEDEITPTCRVEEVAVWINAFIPGHLPGLTLDVPGHPGQKMLSDIQFAPWWECFLTDHRGFSNDIGASARIHQEIRLDAAAGSFRNPRVDIGTTIEVDCDTGEVVNFAVADPSTVRAYDFANPAPGVYSCRLEAYASNPVVWASFNIDWEGNLAIGIFPYRTADGRTIELARIEFAGEVDDFPAFEMYASVNGTPGVPLFQRMPKPGVGPGGGLFGTADVPITGSAVIDCFGNPQSRSAGPAAGRVVPPASTCASCGAAPGSRAHPAGSSILS